MLTLAFYIIVISISLIALGQGSNYVREKAVKKYFKRNRLNYILVCNDSKTTDYWRESIDKEKYNGIEIINVHERGTADIFINGKLLEMTVRKTGVMRYPCLLTIDEGDLKGKVFDSN